jgi:hypothetical protein
MDNLEAERKLTVNREYLAKTLAQSSVTEGAPLDGEPTFIVTRAGTRSCTIRVSSALLSNRHPDTDGTWLGPGREPYCREGKEELYVLPQSRGGS